MIGCNFFDKSFLEDAMAYFWIDNTKYALDSFGKSNSVISWTWLIIDSSPNYNEIIIVNYKISLLS